MTGLRRATVNQYIATYNGDLAAYRQSVLTAFQQVEIRWPKCASYPTQLKRQQEAVDHAQTYLKMEQARFDTGIDPYIDLAVAQTTLYGNEQTLATLQIQQMSASVQLIEALGGGWDKTQLLPHADHRQAVAAETTIQH